MEQEHLILIQVVRLLTLAVAVVQANGIPAAAQAGLAAVEMDQATALLEVMEPQIQAVVAAEHIILAVPAS